MRKSGKIVLLVLLAVIIAATLIACDPTDQQGGNTGGNTGDGGGGTVTQTVPYGLTFDVTKGSSTFAKAVIGEFDLSRDVTGYVLVKTGNSAPRRTGDGFAVTSDMISAEDLAKLSTAGSHRIKVSYEYEGQTLTGSFEVHLQSPATERTAVTFDLGEGRLTNSTASYDETSGLWSMTMDVGAEFTWAEFISAYRVVAPDGYALSHFTYGDGQIFDADGTVTVAEGLSLTAVYTSSYVSVSFDLNAPSDITWSGGEAPAAPATVNVMPSGKVPQPLAQTYESVDYRLLGWSLTADGTDLWNFNSRLSAQTDERGEITLYAVWSLRTALVTFDLAGGSVVRTLPDGFSSSVDGKTLAQAVVTYDKYDDVDEFAVSGIAYGTSLADYYVTFALTDGGETVSVALADLEQLITKGTVYEIRGMYFDKTEDGTGAFLPENTVTSDATVYVVWGLTGGAADDEYYETTYDFILKPDNTYSVTADDTAAEILYIPATFNGRPVTEIASGAFRGMSSVTAVDFSGALNLTKIGANAFNGCSSLERVDGADALSALTTVGKDAFYGTAWMNSYSDGDTDVMLGSVLIRYRGGVDENNTADLSGKSYEYIAAYAFSDYNLSSVVLPAGIKGIDDNAFSGSELSGGVTVAVPAEGESVAIEYIGPEAFAGSNFINNADENIIIGNVFYRAQKDGTVSLQGITVIAEQAFAGRRNLASVTDADAVVSIGADAFRGTAFANNDEDGFVIVNGILAGYYGNASTVVVPDEVKVIASGAFKSGVQNVIFRSTSSLAAIENYAFAEATSLSLIGLYVDGSLTGIDFAPYAFANSGGTALAGNFTLNTSADYDGAASCVIYLSENNRIGAADVTAVTRSEDVFVRDYVAHDDGAGNYTPFTFEDFADAWNVPSEKREYSEESVLTAVTVPDGILVTRNGITYAEDYPITSEESGLDALDTVSGRPQEKTGSIEMSYGGRSFTFSYILHAAIDEDSIMLDDTYRTTEDGTLLFYSSERTFDTSGTITFGYILESGEEAGSAPVAGERVTVSGYTSTVGTYPDGLTVTYDYYGTVYQKTFDYVVRLAQPSRLSQTSSVIIPLGASASDYYDDITVDVIYDDDSTLTLTLDRFTVTDVDGRATSSLVTDEIGLHVATVVYSGSGSAAVSGTVVYSVALVPLYDLYEFDYNDDGTAVITSASAGRQIYALPSAVTDESGKEYTVTAIGNGAFSGNTSVEQVYIPATVTSIGADAFSDCTSLRDLLGFNDDSDTATSGNIGFDKVTIVSEHREGSVSLEITGLNDYALSEDVITFPAAVGYDGEMTLEDIEESLRGSYSSDAEITATYTLTFTLSEDVVSLIAGKLGGYEGVVRIPAASEALAAPLAAYEGLYAALTDAGVNVELWYSSEPSGTDVLVGYIEMQDPSTAQVEFTEKTGYAVLSSTVSVSGNVIVVPETVSGANGVYTIAGIEAGVFGETSGIDAIYIPDSIVYLGGSTEDVFGAAADSVHMYSAASSLVRPHEKSADAEETFPENIVSVGDRAFLNCVSFDIDFSTATKLAAIGNRAFEGTGLTSLVFGTNTALKQIGYGAFRETSVTSVDLSATTVSDIGYAAFADCLMLTEVKLPSTVTQIGMYAFADCGSLTTVEIGSVSQITYIGDYAFHNCTSFDPSVFNGASGVSDSAFKNCKPVA